MKLSAHGLGRRARVEMIPIIDCVFVLLVFFIYSMINMTMRRGLEVQLPAASSVEQLRDQAIVITITAEGRVMINDFEISMNQLDAAIENALRMNPDAAFVLNADENALHGWSVRVMDTLRRRGVENMTILSSGSGE